MNIEEKARVFADGKALAALNQAIEDAYAEGYRDGYKDRENEIPVDLQENKTEFVNLGLPSGTLWASTLETEDGYSSIYVPFEQARKYQLPTKEQYQELLDCCRWDRQDRNGSFDHYVVIGPKGTSIKLQASGYLLADRYENWHNGYFWLSDDDSDGNDQTAAFFGSSFRDTTSKFIGYKLPIHQVR
jgi:hypothetical protein